MLGILARPEWTEGPLAAVTAYLVPRLRAGETVQVRGPSELEDLARLFRLTPAESAASPLRALSVKLYSNSKRLERLLPTADRLSRAVGRAPLSEMLGLSRSYPEVSFALAGGLTFAGAKGHWPCRGQVLTLPLSTVECIQGIELEPIEHAGCESAEPGLAEPDQQPASFPPTAGRLSVLSIENKETFHVLAAGLSDIKTGLPARSSKGQPRLPDRLAGVVYTAGHPNAAVVSFLQLCADAGACLYHYGDLDPDGILILQEIQGILGTPVLPWHMSAAVHRRHARHGYALDQSQAARLLLVDANAHEDLRGLAWELQATGIGVEQEIVDLGEPGETAR